MTDHDRCVEPGCTQEAIVGLQGAWLCLDHFDKRLAAMKATLGAAFRKVEEVRG